MTARRVVFAGLCVSLLMVAAPASAQDIGKRLTFVGDSATLSLQQQPPQQPRPQTPPSAFGVRRVPAVRFGVQVFVGYGRTQFANVKSAADAGDARYQANGFTTYNVDVVNFNPSKPTFGGGLVMRFGNSVLGLNVDLRVHPGVGPTYRATADKPTPPTAHEDITSTLTKVRFTILSIGPAFYFGGNLFIQPLLDLNFWDVTTDNTGTTPASTKLTGKKPGFGVRFAGFTNGAIGVGIEYHELLMDKPTPENPATPWPTQFKARQLIVMAFFRWLQ